MEKTPPHTWTELPTMPRYQLSLEFPNGGRGPVVSLESDRKFRAVEGRQTIPAGLTI